MCVLLLLFVVVCESLSVVQVTQLDGGVYQLRVLHRPPDVRLTDVTLPCDMRTLRMDSWGPLGDYYYLSCEPMREIPSFWVQFDGWGQYFVPQSSVYG